MFHRLRHICILMVLPLLTACGETQTEERPVLAEVGSSYLYKDEMDYLVLSKNHLSDSAEFAEEYVKHWAMDELFYKKAAENVVSSDEIERMVTNYRKSLILNIYQDALVEQQLKPSISSEVVKEFYDMNPTLFKTEEALVRGFILKIADKSPNMAKVRNWCSSITPENVERLEAYATENSAEFDYFAEEWRDAGDVAKGLPLSGRQLETRLSQDRSLEFRQDGWVYFVTADSLIHRGAVLPMNLVEDEVVELLINSRRADFIKQKKRELYDEAVAKGEVKIYNK